jgi:branched-chain amino acid transport system substrate-binding protein
MPSGLLARSRAGVWCASVALAAVFGGCTAANTQTVTVSGSKLTIYSSAPAGEAGTQLAQDIFDAEQLALKQSGSTIGKFTIQFQALHGAKISDNARTAISDKTSIAYLGELDPGASADSMGILNALDLLQVSPTDTALELTQQTSAVPGAPDNYYESQKTYGRTFARVVPNTSLEAKAQVQEMQTLGVRSLYVTDDGSPYGRAIAQAVKSAAGSTITISSSQSGADAVFDGASSATSAQRVFTSAAATNPAVKLFGPSALDTSAVAAALGDTKLRVYVSSPGFRLTDLNASGKKFVADFTAAYGHAPATQAIFGYEAMAAVISVLREAGSGANNRTIVVHDFFGIKNRESVLGTYSINANGDTSLAPYVFSRLSRGSFVPFTFVQITG